MPGQGRHAVKRALGTCALLALLLGACDGEGDAPAGAACEHDGDCGALACVADGKAEPEDLAALPLVCGRPDAAGRDSGEACETAGECARGVCLLAGACAKACAEAADCAELERCQSAFARAEGGAL